MPSGRYWVIANAPERRSINVHAHDERAANATIAASIHQGPAKVFLRDDDLRMLADLLYKLAAEAGQ